MNGKPFFALMGEDVEYNLPDGLFVFLTEAEMIAAFEKLTGYTWQQYLDGEYMYDDIREGCFYRVFDGVIGEIE